MRIGFKEVARLVSYTVLHQLAEPLPLYGKSADFFWRKSLAAILLQRTVRVRGANEAMVDPLAQSCACSASIKKVLRPTP